MLEALATLLVFQTIGEVLSWALTLPVPGPVLGMALLLAALMARPRWLTVLRPTSLELLRHLSLLFVPAGVGVMLHATRIAQEWLPIVVALVVSTALAIVVTAVVVAWSARRLAADSGEDGDGPDA
jgi:holin-like protein